MREAANKKDIVIFKDPHAYSLAPTIAVTDEGEWLVAFNQSLRRSPDRRHPPSDPQYLNHITRSSDQGDTWDYPRVLPGYDFHGVENPGIMRTSNGDILVSVYRRRFFPKETAEKIRDELPFVVFRDPYPWAVTHERTHVHRSEDGGRTWAETSRVDTSPYVSGDVGLTAPFARLRRGGGPWTLQVVLLSMCLPLRSSQGAMRLDMLRSLAYATRPSRWSGVIAHALVHRSSTPRVRTVAKETQSWTKFASV